MPYEYSAANLRDNGYLIKLHGSVDLAICSNDHCRRHSSPYRFHEPEEILHDWPCSECGSQLEVYFLPPHVHKTYRASRYLRLLASIAAKRLFKATEIIAVGYSFPTFDFEALSIFRAARLEPWEIGESSDFLQRVTVVNPSVQKSDYRNRIREIFGVGRVPVHGQSVKLTTFKSVQEFIGARGRPTALTS